MSKYSKFPRPAKYGRDYADVEIDSLRDREDFDLKSVVFTEDDLDAAMRATGWIFTLKEKQTATRAANRRWSAYLNSQVSSTDIL